MTENSTLNSWCKLHFRDPWLDSWVVTRDFNDDSTCDSYESYSYHVRTIRTIYYDTYKVQTAISLFDYNLW